MVESLIQVASPRPPSFIVFLPFLALVFIFLSFPQLSPPDCCFT